jgi:NADPH2:quinone reductase
VDRIIEVAFSDNIDLDAAVARNHTVISAYATRWDCPDFPFWPMLFDNITIRRLSSEDFPAEAKQLGSRWPHSRRSGRRVVRPDRNSAAAGAGRPSPNRVDAGTRARVLLDILD